MMGILDKLKNVFTDSNDEVFEKAIIDTYNEFKKTNKNFYDIKMNQLETVADVMKWSDKQRADFIVYLVKNIRRNNSKDTSNKIRSVIEVYVPYLLMTKINLDEDDAENIYQAFSKNKTNDYANISSWPIGDFLRRLEIKFGKDVLPPQLQQTLQSLKKELEAAQMYDKRRQTKLIAKVDELLNAGKENTVIPVLLPSKDELKTFADGTINALPEKERVLWYQLFAIANKETGSKPSAKFLKQTKAILDKLGEENFKKTVTEWFNFIVKFKEKEQTNTYTYGGREYQNTYYEFLSTPNLDSIKVFVWMCANFSDSALARNIAQLAERCYRKIPEKGPAAAGVGNACFAALFLFNGLEGISQLSRLKLRIKQTSAQSLIEKYLQQAAAEKGVSIYEIEDLSCDDFGLTDGKKVTAFDNYKAELNMVAVGKTEIKWLKPDGSPQKSVPSFVTEKYPAELKTLKSEAKNIETMLGAHRDRIDRMFRTERQMTFEHFSQYYLNHGLVSFIAQKLIWNFSFENRTQTAMYLKNKWINNEGEIMDISQKSTVSLWHPATESLQSVQTWRNFLTTIQLTQPLKQAFREIYLLTDAEVNTKSYSNRMAAHILKQHQFNMLAKTRGWKYTLLGCYDDGRENETAELKLPEHGLKAGFWVSPVEQDGAYNDTGIWNYVATDQIRFTKIDDDKATVDLIDVPVIAFSETLRDVDLFVGVASVGNDPNWVDSGGGLPAYRDYWQSYSFGDLSETAKMRKEILERIVPRLKIGKVSEIKDKFLVVKGKLRTYKIHIGSSNILMEPNDQYLCIVPDRREKDYTQGVFLPFEGDNGLSVVLSKAFLLADDDKITDTTITSQINRK